MMSISKRCHYALQAVLELARREGTGPMTIADIARRRRIPERFLEAILRQLRQGGLTRSERGRAGGYALARPASSIRMGDIIRLFEGPAFQGPKEGAGARKHPPPHDAGDVLAAVWHEAEQALNEVFDAVTFEDLARAEEQEQSKHAPDYTI